MPSPVGGLGACPRKNNQFCTKNYAILSKFWYFFPILQQKVGDYPTSPESGGTYPPVPPDPTPMVAHKGHNALQLHYFKYPTLFHLQAVKHCMPCQLYSKKT